MTVMPGKPVYAARNLPSENGEDDITSDREDAKNNQACWPISVLLEW